MFLLVSGGHYQHGFPIKPAFHMWGKSQTIGAFTFCRPSQIYRIIAIILSLILPMNLAGNGKCAKNWNLRDGGTGAQQFGGLVMSEIHRRRPRRYKFEFSFVGNDRRPSQKSGTRRENRNAPDSPDLSPTIPDDRGYLRFRSGESGAFLFSRRVPDFCDSRRSFPTNEDSNLYRRGHQAMNFAHFQCSELLGSSPPFTQVSIFCALSISGHIHQENQRQNCGDYPIYLGRSAKSKIPDRLGVSRHIKSFINLGKPFFRISRIWNIAQAYGGP